MLVLAILDGWGIGPKNQTNPIATVKPKTIEYLERNYPAGALQASGIAVGLPWNDVGNSEVGHLTIGSGKVVYQHYPRITLAIEKGDFFKNEVFLKAFAHVKKSGGALNIAGLLTEGNVHSAFEHLAALIQFASSEGVAEVQLHLFTDGKDSRPQSAQSLIDRLRQVTQQYGVGVLASISGRHFALDRDNHWDRTKRAYDVLVGNVAPSPVPLATLISQTYDKGESDEFIAPALLGEKAHPITDGDALIFIDYREDSIRQIVEPFVLPEFDKFPIKKFTNLFVVTMTEYTKSFKVPVAFPSEAITHPLGRVLSEAGKTQLLIAETEKYAHVTYFFNGYRDEPFAGQTKFLIPSRNVERHDEEPQMMAAAIGDKVVESVKENLFDVVIVNFANADMVAHTGNFNAGLIAIQTVNEQLGRVVKACEEAGAYLVVTADHGNAEVMIDAMTGSPETQHDPSPVPIYIVGPEFKRAKPITTSMMSPEAVGILSDVAPTVLDILKIQKPKEMTGQSLLPLLTS